MTAALKITLALAAACVLWAAATGVLTPAEITLGWPQTPSPQAAR